MASPASFMTDGDFSLAQAFTPGSAKPPDFFQPASAGFQKASSRVAGPARAEAEPRKAAKAAWESILDAYPGLKAGAREKGTATGTERGSALTPV
ncbi:MAG: hypothetical protein A3J28_10770 [Acidobacteria bacterium RIFCSPLOWO2_12_FULL_60_22]|nr:MAG: hypothetical protein A3J28_10770 [Acidobacteria bacterium RIFCSPLOWO2_12_FULL_60_22]